MHLPFRIYFDFSGYTDIARGSAMLFGYHIPINFNLPYIAKNMSDFWHRWHISPSHMVARLSIYSAGRISRRRRWKTNRNLLITMSLGGLWHGASWSFLVWGLYHGLALVLHREFVALKLRTKVLQECVDSKIGQYLSMLLTFHVVCIGWVFFRIHDIGTATLVAKRMALFSPLFHPRRST